MRNTLLLICLSVSLFSAAQIPAYNATIYDSTVTGYYFLRLGNTPSILDCRGNIVYYFNYLKEDAINGYFGLLPGGRMTYSGNNKYMITDSTFKLVDSFACKNYETDPHEFRELPNGHFLLLGVDTVRMDVSRYCLFRGKCGSKKALVRWAVIQEQDADKNLVWEWRAKDHFMITDADTFYLDDPNYLDINHANALEVDADGNILLSSRNMNEITKIDRKTSKIIWRLGGNNNQFKMINCPIPFYAQHDVRQIANGHITVFDNGENKIPHGARGLEFELNEKLKTAKLIWSYGLDTTFSNGQGNVQRLENSNTLVGFGKINSSKTCFVVVNATGSKIFQLDGVSAYRVLHYPTLPWQINRPQITCFNSVGVTYLDAGAGYSSYLWSDSSTSRIIPITKTGTYQVFVPYGNSGYVGSEPQVIANLQEGCRSKK